MAEAIGKALDSMLEEGHELTTKKQYLKVESPCTCIVHPSMASAVNARYMIPSQRLGVVYLPSLVTERTISLSWTKSFEVFTRTRKEACLDILPRLLRFLVCYVEHGEYSSPGTRTGMRKTWV